MLVQMQRTNTVVREAIRRLNWRFEGLQAYACRDENLLTQQTANVGEGKLHDITDMLRIHIPETAGVQARVWGRGGSCMGLPEDMPPSC